MILPIITVLFFPGVGVQAWQLAQAVPGAGVPNHTEAAVNASARQALVFDAACIATASATPGLISISISPALPVGVSTPAGAIYMAAIRAGGGHNIYGYTPVAPGTAEFLIQNTQGNAAWFRVSRQGMAMNMMTGVTYAVPTMIPIGTLIGRVQTIT